MTDPDRRIYLGDQPPKLALVAQKPTKFIRSVSVTKKVDAELGEDWFDNEILLSHDFVAIIGNKGMGKSALTDIIALTTNSDAPADAYGFLDRRHFRDAADKASAYTATTTWESGSPITRGLEESVPPGTIPLVRYIPQNYFEDLCNETTDPRLLQRELQKVIFSHLSEPEKLGHSTLQELIDDRTGHSDRQIANLRASLQELNAEIITRERNLTSTSLRALEDALSLKRQELAAHERTRPTPVTAPLEPSSSPDLDVALVRKGVLEKQLNTESEQLRLSQLTLSTTEDLENRLRAFEDSAVRLENETAEAFATLGLRYQDIVRISIDVNAIAARRADSEQEIATRGTRLEELQRELGGIQESITILTDALDEPERLYQRYLADQASWEEQRQAIIGTEHGTGSVTNLETRLEYSRNAAQEDVQKLRLERATASRRIHQHQLEKAAFQRSLYTRLQEDLGKNPLIASKLSLEFDAHLVDTGLASRFNGIVNHGVRGVFNDEEEIDRVIGRTNVNDETSLAALLDRITTGLLDGADIDNVERQLKKAATVEELYGFLYGLEYLETRYSLHIKGRALTQLTPGERGSVLLVFYLLADKDDRPLIIDQPEENLDNESVVGLIAPCVDEAKERRQIIMVTHNPNLAVVCDAEQIIWCHIEKERKNKVTYEVGSLENPAMNKHVVDVLEGTWRAFRKRGRKYQK